MTITEIAQMAREMLGAEEEETAKLKFAAELAAGETAEEYLPLRKTQRLKAKGGAILYAAFSAKPLKMVKVLNSLGMPVKFARTETGLAVGDGEYDVTYTYLPSGRDAEELLFPVSVRVLACGAAAEYLTAACRYEEAGLYGRKFAEGLRAACRKGGAVKLAERTTNVL